MTKRADIAVVETVFQLWLGVFEAVVDMQPKEAALCAMRSLASLEIVHPPADDIEMWLLDQRASRQLKADPSRARLNAFVNLHGMTDDSRRRLSVKFRERNGKTLTAARQEKAARETAESLEAEKAQLKV